MRLKRLQVLIYMQCRVMSSEFKRVLGLLELQVKDYQLKRLTDEFVHERELLG